MPCYRDFGQEGSTSVERFVACLFSPTDPGLGCREDTCVTQPVEDLSCVWHHPKAALPFTALSVNSAYVSFAFVISSIRVMQSSAGICAGVRAAVRKSCPKWIGGALELSIVILIISPPTTLQWFTCWDRTQIWCHHLMNSLSSEHHPEDILEAKPVWPESEPPSADPELSL